ncbi:MAG: ParB/RepB/Spo0J family partition protein, partial [Hyphomonas sp.]|nr:ParB/RepB/Spo0J family partition protein [Hyphomonas sp.]
MSGMIDEPKKSSRLGRGLSALIGEVEAVTPASSAPGSPMPAGVSELPIDQIRRNPAQPRRTFDEAALQELADSIRTKGVLQAILVRPDPKDPGNYQIIAGERRWRAAKLAGLKAIPAVVRNMDELELLEVGIIENV